MWLSKNVRLSTALDWILFLILSSFVWQPCNMADHSRFRVARRPARLTRPEAHSNLKRASAFSDIIPFHRRPKSNSPVSGFSKAFGLESLPFLGRSNSNNRARYTSPTTSDLSDNMSDFGLDENELQGVELLDVTHPDSPYALIQDVLKNSNQPANPSGVSDLGGLSPSDVWLADGDLLILKGGTTSEDTSNDVDGSWPPIDNYEAPYREPVFAPESPYEISPPNPAPRNIPFEPAHHNNDKPKITASSFPKQSAQQIIDQQHNSFKNSPPFEELKALLNVETSTQAFSSAFYTLDAANSAPNLASGNPPKSTRVITNDFRPSLRISPSQPASGFQPVYPRPTNSNKISNVDSNRIHRQTPGFDSLISPTTAIPVVKQSFYYVNNSSSHSSNSQTYWDQSDSVFQPPSVGGQTVIHGIYPRIVRQRSPFARSAVERERKIKAPINSAPKNNRSQLSLKNILDKLTG